MDSNIKKEYSVTVGKFIVSFLAELPHTAEDQEKINKMLMIYMRKRNTSGIGRAQNFAAAIIWTYARINFMAEVEGEKWSQKSVAEICEVSKSTMSAKSANLMDELKIGMYDLRFCRSALIEQNPLMQMMVEPRSGVLFNSNQMPDLVGIPLIKNKEDYYFEAIDCLKVEDYDGAIRRHKKAIDIDEHFVAAYLGMARAYYYKKNRKKYIESIDRAFFETRLVFPEWPKSMPWGIEKNRQFLSTISEKACSLWECGNLEEAEKLFRLLLGMNPFDNQGVRYLLAGMFAGITGDEVDDLIDEGNEKQDWAKIDTLLEEQNGKHSFWVEPQQDE